MLKGGARHYQVSKRYTKSRKHGLFNVKGSVELKTQFTIRIISEIKLCLLRFVECQRSVMAGMLKQFCWQCFLFDRSSWLGLVCRAKQSRRKTRHYDNEVADCVSWVRSSVDRKARISTQPVLKVHVLVQSMKCFLIWPQFTPQVMRCNIKDTNVSA